MVDNNPYRKITNEIHGLAVDMIQVVDQMNLDAIKESDARKQFYLKGHETIKRVIRLIENFEPPEEYTQDVRQEDKT